ncbi:hypothetical protein MFUR16E_16790 [Methylobacterium fujisawaense]
MIDVDDPEYDGPGARLGATDYEAFLAGGDPEHDWRLPDDEWDAITLFSLVSLQAFVAQILADLRDAGSAPKPVPVPVRVDRRDPPQA